MINKKQFVYLILFGLLIRIGFSLISFHIGDLSVWKYIGDTVFSFNTSPFIWWAQGPYNFFIILIGGTLSHIFSITDGFYLFFVYHFGFILGDILFIWLCYKINNHYFYNEKYIYTLLIWFNPLLIYVSSIHGQSEQWMLFFSLFAMYAIFIKRQYLGFAMAGFSIGIKYLFIIIFPFLLLGQGKFGKTLISIFSTILVLIFGYIFIYTMNYVMFNDINIFAYISDRLGIIQGKYMPDFNGGVFVATGMNIWGAIYQLNNLTADSIKILTFFKNNWYIFFGFFYLLVFFYHIYNFKKGVIFNFKYMLGIYVFLYTVFFFLFPQTAAQRFLNILPIFFLVFFTKRDDIINILNISFAILVTGILIYAKNEIFPILTIDNNYIGAFLLFILIAPCIILITNKKNLILNLSVVTCMPLMYLLLNGGYYHPFMILTFYAIIFLILILIYKNTFYEN